MRADACSIGCEGWWTEAKTNRLFAHGFGDSPVTGRYRKQHTLDTLVGYAERRNVLVRRARLDCFRYCISIGKRLRGDGERQGAPNAQNESKRSKNK